MNNSNQTIAPAVSIRAIELSCYVVAAAGDFILCKRTDDTFITWRVAMQRGKAMFTDGDYGMSEANGRANLIDRAWGL